MAVTALDYRQQLQELLPPGAAWPRDPDAVLTQLLDGLAEEYARVDAFIAGLVEQMLPDSTTDLLPEWETIAGLPGTCSAEVRSTPAARRVDLLSKLAATGGQSAPYYIEVSGFYGVPITVEEYRPFRTGLAAAGDPLTNGDWVFTWTIRAESLAGDEDAQHTFECLLGSISPSHTLLRFAYVPVPGFKALQLMSGGVLLTANGSSALLLAEKA